MRKESTDNNYIENKEIYEKVYKTFQKVSDDREYLDHKATIFLEKVEEYVRDGETEIQAMKIVAKEMLDRDLEESFLNLI